MLKRPIALSAFIPASDVTEGSYVLLKDNVQRHSSLAVRQRQYGMAGIRNVPRRRVITYGVLATDGTEYSDDADRVRTCGIKIYLFSEGGRKFANYIS